VSAFAANSEDKDTSLLKHAKAAFLSGGEFDCVEREAAFLDANWVRLSGTIRLICLFGGLSLLPLSLFDWSQMGPSPDFLLLVLIRISALLCVVACFIICEKRAAWSYLNTIVVFIAALLSLANIMMINFGAVAWENLAALIILQSFIFAIMVPLTHKKALTAIAILLFPFLVTGLVTSNGSTLFNIMLAVLAPTFLALIFRYRLRILERENYLTMKELTAQNRELLLRVENTDFVRTVIEESAQDHIGMMEQFNFAKEEAQELSIFLRGVLDNISQGISVYDKNFRLVSYNRQLADVLGVPQNLLENNPLLVDLLTREAELGEYGDGDPREIAEAKMRELKESIKNPADGYPWSYDKKCPNNTIVEVSGKMVSGSFLVSTYTDVTEQRRKAEETRLKAMRDPLTKLANRRAFDAEIKSAFSLADENETNAVLVLVDLDNFKPVNDTFGHSIGDKMLQSVAEIIRTNIRGTDFAARLGGDEFAIIYKDVADLDLVVGRISAMVEAISKAKTFEDHIVRIGASVGISRYPNDGADPQSLFESADKALYAAKNAGKGCIRQAEKLG
jgi:diguanylate cyclase (GGDEF)-like protein